MIKEKFIPHLAAIAMLLMLALVGVGLVFNLTVGDEKKDVTTITQPEYMSKIFDKDQMLQVNIQIDESKWEELKANASAETYYPADITINNETYCNIGIRAKGNSSLTMVASDDTTDRYSFKIKVDEYQDQNIYGLQKFVLNNMIGDATYMKEYISYDMYQEMGIATPGYAFANITLNGKPWGVYLAVESLEESFVERNFGSLDGNLYKVESMGNMGGGGGDKAAGGNPPEMPSDMQDSNKQNENMPPQMPAQGEAEERQSTEGTVTGIKPMSAVVATNEEPPAKPDGSDMQVAPEGMPTDVERPERPTGQMPEMAAQGGMGGRGSSGGANLVYSDDELSSYSNIFDYTILNKTTTDDYKTLINILKNLNEGTKLEESIDVEEVLKYFAVNTFLVNLDSYAGNMKHNFYLYEEDGKLQILPWDYNLAFGAFEMSDASKVINFPIDTPVTDSMENSPLIAKLLEVDAYKEMYHDYLQELIDNYITSGKFEETVNQLDTLIGQYIKEDATAFYTYDEYQAGIKELKKYGTDRTTSITAQLSGEQPTTEYGSVATTMNLMAMGQQNGGKAGKGADMDVDSAQGDMQRPQGGGMEAMPNIDMAEMQKVMEVIGEASSIEELTEDQKAQITEIGIDESALESIFTMKKGFGGMGGKGQHNGAPGQATQTKMSTEDKIIAVVCSILLIIGLIFALRFKRKRY